MSTTERHWGILEKINIPPEYSTVKSQIKYLLDRGYKITYDEDYYEDYEEIYIDNNSECVIIKDQWYIIKKKYQRDADFDFGDVVELSPGKYYFNVGFYNGGCNFDSAIDRAMENIIKGDK